MSTTLRIGTTSATSNIENHSVTEDSTPLTAGDTSGGTGAFTVTVDERDKSPYVRGQLVQLEDTYDGITAGVVNSVDGDGVTVTISADSRLNSLVPKAIAAPYVGTLLGAFEYYLSLGGIEDDILLPSYARNIHVALPYWEDSVWDRIKALCTTYYLEVQTVSDNVVVRQPRMHTGALREVDLSWSEDVGELSEVIEVNYYNYEYKADTVLYPSDVFTNSNTITADAREIVVTNLPVSGSIMSIQQPQFSQGFPQFSTLFSIYAVTDKDNVQLSIGEAQRLGVSVSAAIGENGRSIDLTFVGGYDEARAPYSLSVLTGDKTTKAPALVIRGEAVMDDKQTVTVYTGADNPTVHLGATIDVPFISTIDQAWAAAMSAADAYGGPTRTISVTAGEINATDETGIFRYPDFDDFEDEWGATATFDDFSAYWGATATFADFEAHYDYIIDDGVLNQTFGNLAGARVPFRHGIYRVRSGTIDQDSIKYTAEEDSTFAEFEAAWGTTATFADWEAFWSADATFNDFGVEPLWHPVIPNPNLPEVSMEWAKALTKLVEDHDSSISEVGNTAQRAARSAGAATGASGTAVGNANQTATDALREPSAPTEVAITDSGAYWTTAGQPAAFVELTWVPVANDTTGVPVAITQYEVWMYPGSDIPKRYTSITAPLTGAAVINDDDPAVTVPDAAPSVRVEPLERNTDYTYIVRAKSSSGVWGNFSDPLTATSAETPELLIAPSTPVLTSEMSTVTITWDGLLEDGSPTPLHADYAQGYISMTSGGSYMPVGQTIAAGGNITISGLTPGDVRWFKLALTDKAGNRSPFSAEASITVVGVDLGSLDEDVTDAIEAAQAAALDAHSSTNLLADSSFEDNTEQYWDLDATNVTNVTTTPRSGLRNLQLEVPGTPYDALTYIPALPCDTAENYYFRIYARPAVADDFTRGAIEIHFLSGADETTSDTDTTVATSYDFVGTDYTSVNGTWVAPVGALFFRPVIKMVDDVTTNIYYLDDAKLFRMVGETLIVDGSIVADKLAADSVVAGKIGADAIAAINIQAEAVTAEKLAADSVTANAIVAGTITGDKVAAGAIETNNLSPAVGNELDISANNTVTIIAGNVSDVQDGVDATNDNLTEMQTFYSFGPDGALITAPDSPFGLSLQNDGISMLENGNVVSYWNSGQMHVASFVGDEVILGNHKLEKYGTGTVGARSLMAIYDAALNAGYTLRLEVNYRAGSMNIAANTTIVDWSLYVLKGPGSGKFAGGPNYWSKVINGVYSDGTVGGYDFRSATTWVLATGAQTIAHNADGTKTISVSGGYGDGPYGDLGGNTASGSLALPTIPRASNPTLSPASLDAGSTMTITTNRASTAFTHTITYVFGAASGTIDSGVTTSTTWTPPLSLLAQIPSSLSGAGTIVTKTYNGATLIGTVNKSFTLTVPTSVVPTFTTVTNSEATAGVAAAVGAYVKNVSTLALAITGAAGAYGSTITSYKITAAGQTINASSGTTTPINASGTVPLVGTVTDSRGRTYSATVNVTVLNYAPPAITTITAQRSLSSGVLDDNGTYIKVAINAGVSSLINGTQKNAIKYRIYTRLHGNTTWTSVDGPTAPGGITYNSSRVVGTYPITNSYDVLVEISDLFATSAQILTVPTAKIFMHWDAGVGMGVGKYRQNGVLDVGGDIYQNDSLVLDAADLATNAETQTGTSTSKVVTPAGLTARTATDTRTGIAELATQAEVNTGTDAGRVVTPATLRNATNIPWAQAAGVVVPSTTNTGTSSPIFWNGSLTVTLPVGRFSQAPIVTVDTQAMGGIAWSSLDLAPTTSSFTVRTMRVGAYPVGTQLVHWHAIQMTSASAEG